MKPWYASKTVAGLVVALIGAALALGGFDTEVWGPILAAGLAAAGFGRAVAQGPLVGRLLLVALLPAALLTGGCAGTLWPPAIAAGNSGVCLEDYDWTPLRLPTPEEARALGLAGETPTAEEPLSPGEHCAGPYVWGGEVSRQAAEGVGSVAEVALPPILTGAGVP